MIDRRGFLGLIGIVGLSLAGCGNSTAADMGSEQVSQAQPQVSEADEQPNEQGDDRKLYGDYIGSDEVKGFTAAAGAVLDAYSSYLDGDYDACLAMLDQSTLDAFDALIDKKDVPAIAAEVHGDFVDAASAYQAAAIDIMVGSQVDDESRRQHAGDVAFQQISDASDFMSEAAAAMDRAQLKVND